MDHGQPLSRGMGGARVVRDEGLLVHDAALQTTAAGGGVRGGEGRGDDRMKPFHMYWAYQDRNEPAHHSYVMYACEQMASEGVDDATCSVLPGNGEDYASDRTMDAGPRVGRDVAERVPGRTRAGGPDGGNGSEGTRASGSPASRAPASGAEVPVSLIEAGSPGGVTDVSWKGESMDT